LSERYQWHGDELTEADVLEICEHLIRMKAQKFVFKGYDKEDIAQEIRLSCLKAWPKFEKGKMKGSPIKFFNMVSENHLRNLKRDKLYAFRPPCERCEFRNKKNKDKCDKFKDKMQCKLFTDYLLAFETKVNLANPITLFIESRASIHSKNPASNSWSALNKHIASSSLEDLVLYDSFSKYLDEQQKTNLGVWMDGEKQKILSDEEKEEIVVALAKCFGISK